MGLPQQRRRRSRPACSWQQVMLCACLGLGAQTIVPIEAWVPGASLFLQGLGPATTRGAISCRPAIYGRSNQSWGQSQRHRRRRPQVAGETSAIGGDSSNRARGIEATTRTSAFRQQRTVSAFSSRSSSWPGRPVASSNPGGRRGSFGVRMSMAEEEGGAKSDGYNPVLGALAVAGLGVIYYGLHGHTGGSLATDTGPFSAYAASFETVVQAAKAGPSAATAAIQAFLSSSVTKIEELGPLGPLYFGLLYILAEVLIIPALPLSTAAGFLFGAVGGTAVVLTSATIAAALSFQLGRTLLRQQVEALLDDNPKFRVLDKAIAKEGFKVVLLLRLSPIFPFALSNYLYGATSVDFFEYMMGTLLGFFPGTLAYVYGGTLGKAATNGGGMALPWYGYAAGAVLVAVLLKTVGDIATTAVEELEESDP